MNYETFLQEKAHVGGDHGFDPVFMPSFLFDFQASLVEWAVRKGRAAIFADCGMGKTPMQLVWAQNVVQKTNGRVIVLTPLSVSAQMIAEAEKFGIAAVRSRDGTFFESAKIVVTNYEKLHLFRPDDFVGLVCDESSILKNMKGAYKNEITRFMRKHSYRLLATATAAPNDYHELGTSSEALGYLGAMDMLNKFFRNTSNDSKIGTNRGEVVKWVLRSHAEGHFWRWVTSWSRALRKPSDLGFDDRGMILPQLIEREHLVDFEFIPDGQMFAKVANGLGEQRQERRRSLESRCEKVVSILSDADCAIAWGQMNDECNLMERVIPGAVQVSGTDSDEEKEEKFAAFSNGQARVLVTKPKIGALGLNFQHCNRMTFFPSHSYEQYYQGVRRCWRFGQKRPVTVDIVTTPGEIDVLKNLQRKQEQADKMFAQMIENMGNALEISKAQYGSAAISLPTWI